MLLRTLFVVACVSNLNACPDWIWCCGNREVSVDLECEIEDLDDLKLSLEHKLSKYQNGDWVVPLSNGKNISGDSSNPPKVSCSLEPGVIETDDIRFDVKDENGKKTVKWLRLERELNDDLLDKLAGRLEATVSEFTDEFEFNYIDDCSEVLDTNKSFTKFLLVARRFNHKKALLDRNAKKIYVPGDLSANQVFVWQIGLDVYRGVTFRGEKLIFLKDLRDEWECDIDNPEELKTILETKTTVTTKEDGSWYADLDWSDTVKFFIFVDKVNEKSYCDLNFKCIKIHDINFTVVPAVKGKSLKRIQWAKPQSLFA